MTEELLQTVQRTLSETPIIDMHTHLFMPSLGELGLWGIDELVTYHYLEAELFRSSDIQRRRSTVTLSKLAQADLIWRTLFVENAPISEATRGVIAVLQAFGLSTGRRATSGSARVFCRAGTAELTSATSSGWPESAKR